METTTASKSHPGNTPISGKLLMVAAVLGVLTLAVPVYFSQTLPPPDTPLKMEKSSGKNEKHANPKARETAEQEYEKVKEQLQEWNRKPNKTPDDKKIIKRLRKTLERLRKKKDFSGENHSQKGKGF